MHIQVYSGMQTFSILDTSERSTFFDCSPPYLAQILFFVCFIKLHECFGQLDCFYFLGSGCNLVINSKSI